MKARLTDLGDTPLAGSPADFGKLIADAVAQCNCRDAGRSWDGAILSGPLSQFQWQKIRHFRLQNAQ
jgi:hypothetical protein